MLATLPSRSNQVWRFATLTMSPLYREPFAIDPPGKGEVEEFHTLLRSALHYICMGNGPAPCPPSLPPLLTWDMRVAGHSSRILRHTF